MIIGIIIGFVAGTFAGKYMMCLISAGHENERLSDQYYREHPPEDKE